MLFLLGSFLIGGIEKLQIERAKLLSQSYPHSPFYIRMMARAKEKEGAARAQNEAKKDREPD